MQFKQPPRLSCYVEADCITTAKSLGIEEAKRSGLGVPVRVSAERVMR
jgi:hypothetical protein